jgi:mRNA interferase RelE/StbE
MTYELGFLEDALKEWHKLDATVRDQFKSKLAERLKQPRVPASKLSGHSDRYKIKLRPRWPPKLPHLWPLQNPPP